MGIWLQALIDAIKRLFQTGDSHKAERVPDSFYDFKIRTLKGDLLDFSIFRGKKVLIVNTASRCGYTPQLASLQRIHERYAEQVAVLGFPSNDFLWQEPGSNSDIAEFCELNYGVTFQMFEKISVKGKGAHPLFKWLEKNSKKVPEWNFSKFLLNSNGDFEHFYSHKLDPADPVIIKSLES